MMVEATGRFLQPKPSTKFVLLVPVDRKLNKAQRRDIVYTLRTCFPISWEIVVVAGMQGSAKVITIDQGIDVGIPETTMARKPNTRWHPAQSDLDRHPSTGNSIEQDVSYLDPDDG